MSARAAVAACLLSGCLAAAVPGQEDEPEAPGVPTLVCDRAYLPAAVALIGEGAPRVAQWELFEGDSTASLEDALAANPDVRLLLDDELDTNVQAAARLAQRGVDVGLHADPEVRLHAKVLASETRALVGSTNWSDSSIERNRECNISVAGGPIPAALRAWVDGLDEPDRGPRLPPGSDPLLVVDDELLPSLLSLADSADDRLDVTLYATFLQPDNPDAPAMRWFAALGDAVERGVTVRVLADWSDWDEANTKRNGLAVDWLRARGVTVRWDRPDVTLHAKVAVSESGAQVQTANPSTSGFERNREAGIYTTDDAVLDALYAWYEARWFEGREEGW